jgi:hypothetical protein
MTLYYTGILFLLAMHEIAINGRDVQLNKHNKSGKSCCLQTSDMYQCAVTGPIYRQGCVWLLFVGLFMAAVLTLWEEQTGRGVKGNTATFFRIPLRRRLKMSPKRWYHCIKTNGVKICNSLTLIFTAVVNLNCRGVLPCFSFPVNLTRFTHGTAPNRHPEKVTAECG